MSWRGVVVGAGLAAAIAAAGCGGGTPSGDRNPPVVEEFEHLGGLNLVTQHAEWAIVVCKDVAAWLDAVNAAAEPLPRQAGEADRSSLRASLQRAFADLTRRTDRLVTRVRSYRHPHVPNGRATAAAFNEALAAAGSTITQERDAVAAAPVDDPAAFQSALDHAHAAIDQSAQTVRAAYAEMEKRGPDNLRRMFGQRDECIPIFQDLPTGPAPVAPHTR